MRKKNRKMAGKALIRKQNNINYMQKETNNNVEERMKKIEEKLDTITEILNSAVEQNKNVEELVKMLLVNNLIDELDGK